MNEIHEIHPLVKRELIEIYQSFAKVCDVHGLRYWAGYGTLLGAIRHKGFIPWDDDFDVVMLRDDYEKFINVVSSELPSYHKLVTLQNCHVYGSTFAKIQESRREVYDKIRVEADYINPHGLYIDIFPLDGKPEALFPKLIDYIWCLMTFCRTSYLWRPYTSGGCVRRLFKMLGRVLGVFYRDKTTRRDFAILCEKWMKRYCVGHCSHVRYFDIEARFQMKNDFPMPKKAFDATLRVPFEDISVPAPSGYADLLRVWYGDNYMTPPSLENRVSQHSLLEDAPWMYGPVN